MWGGTNGEKGGISQSVFPILHKINSPFVPIFPHFSPFSSNFLWHFCEKFAIAVELKFNCGKAFERQCPRETLPICCHMGIRYIYIYLILLNIYIMNGSVLPTTERSQIKRGGGGGGGWQGAVGYVWLILGKDFKFSQKIVSQS